VFCTDWRVVESWSPYCIYLKVVVATGLQSLGTIYLSLSYHYYLLLPYKKRELWNEKVVSSQGGRGGVGRGGGLRKEWVVLFCQRTPSWTVCFLLAKCLSRTNDGKATRRKKGEKQFIVPWLRDWKVLNNFLKKRKSFDHYKLHFDIVFLPPKRMNLFKKL
jgi:hypothetical protein